jgi:DNA-binding NtrC family response regulator
MNGKVLIVEDEFIVANDLRVILHQAGYKVTGIAASVDEADEILQTNRPDLVLLDIRLDGKLTGIDFARKLKADNVAFIYISANSSQEILEEVKTTDPYGFIVKPFREKDLLVSIDIALYRHKHSLESKLRLTDLLQKQITEIGDQKSEPKQKLLRMAKAFQTHIPFDLIVCATRPITPGNFDDLAYQRIGFDEYQFIGKHELMTITRLKESTFFQIVNNSKIEQDAVISNERIPGSANDIPSLQTVLSDAFKLQSFLIYPVSLHKETSVYYYFYSRQRDVYTKSHISILDQLKAHLRDLAEVKMSEGMASADTLAGAANGNHETSKAARGHAFAGIVGSHPLLLAALDHTMQVAQYNTSVLILGESGTGKENVAKSIHALSPRKNAPFVKVNCAAIPPTLIESELFGHEKGAFTGAFEKRKGKFEQAQGGTIFLDEIGELPLEMQVKLLRVLQEKEIEYVGSSLTKKVDVRIIAATNRNLEKEVANGTFRLDLYYRLNVFPITLPPLRDRKSDIEALALFFADKFCNEFNKPFHGISESMMEEMHAFDWPGNIRELVNVLEQSVILNDGKSKLKLKQNLTVLATELSGKMAIETFDDVKHIQRETEKEYILSVLKKTKGLIRGVHGAAELLNIKPTTLESKITKLGIRREDFINRHGN